MKDENHKDKKKQCKSNGTMREHGPAGLRIPCSSHPHQYQTALKCRRSFLAADGESSRLGEDRFASRGNRSDHLPLVVVQGLQRAGLGQLDRHLEQYPTADSKGRVSPVGHPEQSGD